MRILSIDIETYSDVDLIKSGVYPYAESPNFEILLLAYAWDDEPVQLVDLTAGEKIPTDVKRAIKGKDPNTLCSAFNANFERICLSEYFNKKVGYPLRDYISPKHWICSAVHSRYLGIPGHLAGAAKALKLAEQKDKTGKSLISYFCKPCKPTKVNKGRTRNLPEHAPEKWEQFRNYNIQDVEVERAVRVKLSTFPVPQSEWDLWYLDQEIIDRGVMVNMQLARNAIEINDRNSDNLRSEMTSIAPSITNPGSVSQIKSWLKEETGNTYESLDKEAIKSVIEDNKDNQDVKRVLSIRKELGKSSTSKYVAMQNSVCSDNRIRGLIMFYGGSRTGRWAGRLVQVQNLPRNKLNDLDDARNMVLENDFDAFEMFYSPIPFTLSELIRTAFVAPDHMKFIISDFSAIEARVIAWLAGEQWRLDVFNTHGKIYEASASAMFGIPIEKIGHDSPLRAKGKIAELALGYQGSLGALKQMGGEKMGLTDLEMKRIVSDWRSANPHITQLWTDVEAAAKDTIVFKRENRVKCLKFLKTKGVFFIELPSGRRLTYQKTSIGTNRFGGDTIMYYGNDSAKGYSQLETYGGKLVENIIQAIARDCLAVAMQRMAERGYNIVMHVHDEVIIEATKNQKLDDVNDIMAMPIDWAPGLPLKGAGFETQYYMKD